MNKTLKLLVTAPFRGWVEFGRYEDGSVAMLIREHSSGGECIVKATVHMPDAKRMCGGDFWLKTWSENSGLLECLEESGICERTGEILTLNPHCQAWGAKLTELAREELNRQINAA